MKRTIVVPCCLVVGVITNVCGVIACVLQFDIFLGRKQVTPRAPARTGAVACLNNTFASAVLVTKTYPELSRSVSKFVVSLSALMYKMNTKGLVVPCSYTVLVYKLSNQSLGLTPQLNF